MRHYIDLSHTLYDGLVTYKGVPGMRPVNPSGG